MEALFRNELEGAAEDPESCRIFRLHEWHAQGHGPFLGLRVRTRYGSGTSVQSGVVSPLFALTMIRRTC